MIKFYKTLHPPKKDPIFLHWYALILDDCFVKRPPDALFHTILIFISKSYYSYLIIMCYTQVVDIVKIEYKNKSVPFISVSLDDSYAGHAGPHSRSMLSIQGFKKIDILGNQKLSAPLLSLFMLSNVYNFHFYHLYIVFLCFLIPPL